MKRRVKWYKATWIRIRSWLAFIAAFAILAGFWYFCYWTVDNYAGRYQIWFKYGAYVAIGIGAIMLIFNELIVKWSTGAIRIKKREQCPKLWDAVVSVSPWPVPPRMYIVPTDGINAMSFGWGITGFSAVGATQGAIDELNDDELKAVMAHEVGHIINKDILVSMAMAITVMMMAFTGWCLLRLGPYSSGDRRSSSDKKGGGALAVVVAIIIGALLYFGGRLLGVILQMFVSRQREYAADAKSARIIGTSKPLISALVKITRCPSIASRTANGAFGFLCTEDPDPTDLLSTHPDPEKRLEALEWLET